MIFEAQGSLDKKKRLGGTIKEKSCYMYRGSGVSNNISPPKGVSN